MSREIKFRAWDKKNEIYLCNVQDACGTAWEFVKYDDVKNESYDESCFGDFLDNKRYDVEQYTGLKDANGKKIYEGDIIHFCYKGIDFYAPVVFEEGAFTANVPVMPSVNLRVMSVGEGYHFLADTAYFYCDMYIAGNIHENPELLEADK